MPIPTQGLTEKMQLTSDTTKLNAQRAAIHADQVCADITADQAAKLNAMLGTEHPVDPDSVAAKTGGDPNDVIKIVEHGGLRVQATKDMITVLDLYNGTDKAFIQNGAPKESERFIPPLSAKTLAEMEAGRKRLAEHSATYRPPPVEDKTVGQTLPAGPGDHVKPFTSKLG
jgi:hypothetical protein